MSSLREALNMRQEVVSLCNQVEKYGTKCPDELDQISFGQLHKINERISSRFCSILETARQFRLMEFPGKKLDTKKDAEVVIKLMRRNREIQEYFRHTNNLLPNYPDGNLWIDLD